MLLGRPQTTVTGVTTTTDPGGLRAGMTAYALRLAGREDVPLAAGAEGTLAEPMVPFEFPDYWPEPIRRRPSPPGAALELLAAKVVLERCDPLVVPLAATAQAHLRAGHLPRLRAAGPLGGLLAGQAEAHARDQATTELGGPGRGSPTTCSTSSTTRWPARSPSAGTA